MWSKTRQTYRSKMAEMRGASILLHEIEKAKDKLKDVNENIKKLTGRDPEDIRPARGRQQEARGRGRLFNLARRAIIPDESGGPPPAKRRNFGGGAFSRLGPMPQRRREQEDSGDEDELRTKVTVQSSVVATPKDTRSRKDSLAEQSGDKEGMQRNRRMFGLLLGTLQKFKTEAQAEDQKSEQRKKIEKKLEADAEREKQQYRQETQQLIEESQQEQARITRLQQKMELVSEHEASVAETKKLQNFICTRAKPRIFWLPKTMTSAAQNRLKDSKKVVDKMLKEKSDALEREINEVMEREERIRSRQRHDSTGMPDKENAANERRSRGDKESTKDSGKSSRHSRDKKSGHHEARKKQPEMHYEDEEEEMEEEEVEGARIELGDREVVVAAASGDREGKGEKAGPEGGATEAKGEGDEAEQVPKKPDPSMSSFDDGNNTDVDYDDDEVHNSSEMQSSFSQITAIPLPDDMEVSAKMTDKKENSESEKNQSQAGSEDTAEGTGADQSSGVSEVREEQLYMERGQEVLRTTATMAEDEADMEEDPADE